MRTYLQNFENECTFDFFLKHNRTCIIYFIFLTLKTTHIPTLLLSNLQQVYISLHFSSDRKKTQQKNSPHIHMQDSLKASEQSGLFQISQDSILSDNSKEKQPTTHKQKITQLGTILLINFTIIYRVKANCWASVKFPSY